MKIVVDEQLWWQLHGQLGEQCKKELWELLWDQLDGRLWDQLQGQLGGSLLRPLHERLRSLNEDC